MGFQASNKNKNRTILCLKCFFLDKSYNFPQINRSIKGICVSQKSKHHLPSFVFHIYLCRNGNDVHYCITLQKQKIGLVRLECPFGMASIIQGGNSKEQRGSWIINPSNLSMNIMVHNAFILVQQVGEKNQMLPFIFPVIVFRVHI